MPFVRRRRRLRAPRLEPASRRVRAGTPPAPSRPSREIRVTVVNDTPGRGRERGEARAAAGLDGDAGRADREVHARRTSRRPCGFRCSPAPNAARGRVPRQARARVGGRPDVRPRLSGDRVSAHPAAAHLRRGGRDAEGDRRQDGAEPDGRLRHGRRRPGAARHRAARREGRDDRPRRSRVGRPVAGSTPSCTGVRAYERRDDLRANNSRLLEYVRERRHADRAVQPFEFNDAVRPVSGAGRATIASPTSTRRCRFSSRRIRCSRRRTRSPMRRGRDGCRSAG